MNNRRLLASFLWIVIFGLFAAATTDPPDNGGTSTSSQPSLSSAECRRDLQCWAEEHFAAATVRCDDAVERLAKYAHEWTDGMLEPKFSHFRWKDQAAGHVTYIGDKIRFQNGFGAWVPHVYECDFDPNSEQVLDVRAESGRLPE